MPPAVYADTMPGRRRGRRVKKLCIVIGIGGFVFLPLVYSPTTIDPDTSTRMILLGLLLAIAGVWLAAARNNATALILPGRGWMIALGPLLLYVLLSVSDLRGGPSLGDGLTDLTRIFLWFATILLILLVFRGRDCFAIASRAATVGALFLSVIAVFQFAGWGFGFIPGHGFPSATMANKNLLASALVILLPWLYFDYLTDSRWWRTVSLTAAIPVTFIIVVVEARASWLALILSALTVALLWRLVGRGTMTRATSTALIRGRLLTLAIVMVVVAAVSVPIANRSSAGDSVAGRIQASVKFEAGSVAERLALWKASLQMMDEHPLRGVGLGQWRIEQPRFGAKALRSAGADVFYQRPHNDYLWVGAELGAPGMLIYLAIYITALILGINKMRSAVTTEDRVLAMLVSAGLVAYMVVASFSYPRERMVHLFLSAVMIGVAVRPTMTSMHGTMKLGPRIIGGVVLVFAVCGIAVGCIRYRSEAHTSRLWQAFAQHDYDSAEQEAKLAETFLYHIDPVSTSLQWYIGVAQLQRGDVDSAQASFERAAEYTPYHPHVWSNLAACYERQGDHRRAAELYERALALSPEFQEALVNLGAVYFNEGQYRKALDALNRAAKINTTPVVEEYLDRVRKVLGLSTSGSGN